MYDQAIAEISNALEQSLNNGLLPFVVLAIIVGTALGVSKLLLKRIINFLRNL